MISSMVRIAKIWLSEGFGTISKRPFDRMMWKCAHLREFGPRTTAEKVFLELDMGKACIPLFDVEQCQTRQLEVLCFITYI